MTSSILQNSPALRTLEELTHPPADPLSYITSTTVFLYIDETYNQSRIRQLISSASSTHGVHEAIETTFRKTFDEFEAEWRECLTGSVVAIADAQAALRTAELEHRTLGLDEVRTALSEAVHAFNTGEYRKTTSMAREATRLAQSSIRPPVRFELSGLVISPREAATGEPVTVTANVTNTGETQGQTTITLEINEVPIENRTVNLGPAQSQKITFTISRDNEGTYRVSVGELEETLTIKKVSQFPTPLLLILPLLMIPVYLVMRKTKKTS